MVKVQIVFCSSYLLYFDVSCSFLLKQKSLCFTTTPVVSCYLFLGSEGSMKCSITFAILLRDIFLVYLFIGS